MIWIDSGGLLLSFLATSSSVLDHYLRSINQGFSIGFTSVLIIVSVLSTFQYHLIWQYRYHFSWSLYCLGTGWFHHWAQKILSCLQCNAEFKQSFEEVWCITRFKKQRRLYICLWFRVSVAFMFRLGLRWFVLRTKTHRHHNLTKEIQRHKCQFFIF